LSVWTHHKFWKFRSFLLQKVRSSHLKNPLVGKMSALEKTPPLCLRMSLMDGPLCLFILTSILQ